VYYPDKRPTQRIGIVPDIEAKPTITGIEAGRDEVLEVGIQHILGSDASSGDIQKIARAGGDKPGDFLQSR
jgi:C-terminal processing protease CtpA/Prc